MLMKNTLSMWVIPAGGEPTAMELEVKRVGCSRHAARDVESTREFLSDLRGQGYQAHDAAGVCFRSRYLLTNEEEIEVQGPQTSGEVEFVALRHRGELLISVGSDHNDRSLGEMWTAMLGKVYDTAKAKQMVPAVVARDAWRYADVKAHWDDLVLKSYVTVSGRRIPYQAYSLAELLDLEYYLAHCPWLGEQGSVLLGGSGPILDSVPPEVYQGQSTLENVIFPHDFHLEMVDPVLDRTLAHVYTVCSLEGPGSLSL